MTWQTIARELAEQIENGELSMGTRLESEDALATRLGVPRHTAHRALDELLRRGLVTRQRRMGTVVADRRRKDKFRIAYIFDTAGNYFQADLLMRLEQAQGEDDTLVIATHRNSAEREAMLLKKLREEVDGIICYPADGDENASVFLDIVKFGFPLVLIDRAPRGCEQLGVHTDNLQASKQAVSDLIARGHQRIAFFGGSNDQTQSFRERFLGYRMAVQELGYVTRPYERWVPLFMQESTELMVQTITDGLSVMRALPEPPTAAFCVQDRISAILIEACGPHGLQIGVDFGIATYNDFGPSFFSQSWRLDRIVQPTEGMATVSMERVKALIRGETPIPGPVRLPATLYPAADSRSVLSSTLRAPWSAPSR